MKEAQAKTVGKAKGGNPRLTGSRTDPVSPPTLAEAGIDERAQRAANKAFDSYMAKARAERTPPTVKGLRVAVRQAVRAELGPPPKRAKPYKPDPVYVAWLDWTTAVTAIADGKAGSFGDMARKARDVGLIADDIDHARVALERLPECLAALERENKR